MRTLVLKSRFITTILLLFFACSISAFSQTREQIEIEGTFLEEDMRSLPPANPVDVFLTGTDIDLTFYGRYLSVEIKITEVATNNTVYLNTVARPEYINIPLAGNQDGLYLIELRTKKGYIYGNFLLVN